MAFIYREGRFDNFLKVVKSWEAVMLMREWSEKYLFEENEKPTPIGMQQELKRLDLTTFKKLSNLGQR